MKTQTAFIALCAAILNASAFAQEAATQNLAATSVPTEVANIAVAAIPATEAAEKRQLLEEIELDEEDENLEDDLDMDEEDLVDEEEDEEDENLAEDDEDMDEEDVEEDDLDLDEEDIAEDEDMEAEEENLAEDDEDMDEEDVDEDDLDLDEEDLEEEEEEDENVEEADEELDEEDLAEDDEDFDEEDLAEDDEDFDEEDLAEDDEDFDEEDLAEEDAELDEEDVAEEDDFDVDVENLVASAEKEMDVEDVEDDGDDMEDVVFDDLDFDEEDVLQTVGSSLDLQGPYERSYLPGYAFSNGQFRFRTLGEARAAAFRAYPSARGITQEPDGTFTLRAIGRVTRSPVAETSWLVVPRPQPQPVSSEKKKRCKKYATRAAALRHKVFSTIRNVLELKGRNAKVRSRVIRTILNDGLDANRRLYRRKKIAKRDFRMNRTAFKNAIDRLRKRGKVNVRAAGRIFKRAQRVSKRATRKEDERQATIALRRSMKVNEDRPYTEKRFFADFGKALERYGKKEVSKDRKGRNFLRGGALRDLAKVGLRFARFVQKRGLFKSNKHARRVMKKLRNLIRQLRKMSKKGKSKRSKFNRKIRRVAERTVKRIFPIRKTYSRRSFFRSLNRAMVKIYKRHRGNKRVMRREQFAVAKAALSRARRLKRQNRFAPRRDGKKVMKSLKATVRDLRNQIRAARDNALRDAIRAYRIADKLDTQSRFGTSKEGKVVKRAFKRIIRKIQARRGD